MRDRDEFFMREALRVAEFARGRTSPNPMVGAVIVREEKIIALGWHRKAGTPHAEVHALNMAGELARGAELFVTLEPCSHFGKTPPCANAIIRAGIRRVVVAMRDPNPKVNGRGIQLLRDAGIEVTENILHDEAAKLNEIFFHWIQQKTPFVMMKMAMTLDGKIATAAGQSKWITSERAREFAHELRNEVDGILVGIETVLKDDPQLTTRLKISSGKNFLGKNPVRIILDSKARTPINSQILKNLDDAPTWIICHENAPKENVERLQNMGAKIFFCGDDSGRIDIQKLMKLLGEKEILSLLVEGGGTVHFSFLEKKCVQKVFAIIAPKIFGGKSAKTAVEGEGFQNIADAVQLNRVEFKNLGEDFALIGYIN